MKRYLALGVAFAALFYCRPVEAQNSGAVPQYAVPIGKGAGVTGFGSAAPGATGTALVSNGPGANPTFQAVGSASFVAQNANKVFSGPATGADATPTFRALVGADLPLPAAATLGGVKSLAASTNNFLTGLGTDGAFTLAQPAFSNLSGSWSCAQTAALTGNVTTSAGSCVTTIANLAVTNGMLAGSIAASKLIGTDIATVGTIATGTWHGTKIGLAYGGTNADLSATGGTSQVVKQTSAGAALTVGQLAASDLSNGVSGTGAIALAASPTFTGVPAVPTATTGTNTTQIASTAFVNASVAASGVSSIDSQTGSFTTGNGVDSSGKVIELTAARRTLPTTQIYTSSSGTFTTPANALWLEIDMIGGGGGGAGSGTTPGAGGAGGNTTFGTALLVANGGGGGLANTNGGSGGTGSGGYLNSTGGFGQNGAATTPAPGGNGCSSAYGNFGFGGVIGNGTGITAGSGSGSGGGGAGSASTANSGAGGGCGARVRAVINNPAASYSYAVGTAGSAGTAGTGGAGGGAGGTGLIQIIVHYGS